MSSNQHRNSSIDEGDDLYIRDQDLLRPVTSHNQFVPNRSFYPLDQHQQEFDEIERVGGLIERIYGLNRLTDYGNEQPPHTCAVIIKCAILGSPFQRLTLREIRIAMCRRFAYYSKSENTGWCNTIRHILSTDTSFRRVDRPKTVDDAGSWWKLINNAEPPDLKPATHARSRRPSAQASGSGSSSGGRLRPQGIPAHPRRKKVEPWMRKMTTTFTTSETQDREDLRLQYANIPGGHSSIDYQQYYATGHYASPASSSTAHLGFQRPSEAANSVDSSRREPLPGIHSLGILDLGTRSGGRSHHLHSQPSTSHPENHQNTQFDIYDENEDYYDEENEDDA